MNRCQTTAYMPGLSDRHLSTRNSRRNRKLMELRGTTAIITGGALRVGRAFGLALARCGVNILVHYNRSRGPAAETAQAIEAHGVRAVTHRADLSQDAQIETIVPAALEAFGRVDILINNASVFEPGDFATTTAAEWDRNLQINLKAPFLLSQAFAAALPEGRPGKIINMVDWRALRPGADHFAYTISKAGLVALTRSLAVALAPRDIQVNALALGAILPPAGATQEYLDRLTAQIPARRFGGPQDVVNALLYLLEGGDYVTGEVLLIDGGRHLV